MIKYIGFDKDGTLLDSIPTYARIWGEIMHKHYGIDEKQASSFLLATSGQSTVIQVETLLKNNNIAISKEDAFIKANEIATELGEKANSQPFPEIPEVLKKLKEQGFKIFVSSGQQEKIIQEDLKRTNLTKYVDFYAGVEPKNPGYTKGLPHFKAAAKHFGVDFETFVKETIFLGDTPSDIKYAKEAGIPAIIRKNSIAEETLLNEGAKFVVEDFSGLLEIISSLS